MYRKITHYAQSNIVSLYTHHAGKQCQIGLALVLSVQIPVMHITSLVVIIILVLNLTEITNKSYTLYIIYVHEYFCV